MLIRSLMMLSIIGLLSLAVTAQRVTPTERTIVVTGTAERMVSPDVALISLAVVTQGETVARAIAENNTVANNITAAIQRLNIAGLTLRTASFDVSPMYEQVRDVTVTRPPRIVGFQVTNRLEVRIANPNATQLSTAVGQVLDAALAAGANRVDSVQFTLGDNRRIMQELMAAATQNAADNARAVAAAAGVRLGRPVTISSTPYFQPPQPLYARAEAAASVPIIAGEMTVRATVNAIYSIE